MQNINYDLIKMLHGKLDNAWRIEKYYLDDATKAKCHSVPVWERMLAQEKKDIEDLISEIKMRMDAGAFT
ncbi:hypothetical protein EDM68_00500 [Candidatus Uhrbacteria bacterium]|nr:MAG: hypothetical protein EDM68_00500 [Candidatus Uhrbacteria bacterium]